MAQAHYLIVEQKAGWFITFEGTRWGPMMGGRIGALVAAVQIAHQAGKDGHDADVRLWALGGLTEIVWCFGRDAYPPSWAEQLRLEANPRPRGGTHAMAAPKHKPTGPVAG